jgi:hypothetical protein
LRLSKSKIKNRGKAKRLIAIPADKHRPYLFFESQGEIRDFFQLPYGKFVSALEDGNPVCLGDVVYYIDEDLFE